MRIIDQLASSLNRRDEIPNQELAQKIANDNDTEAIQELVNLLQHKKKDIQHDAIKVIYEIGERRAELIAPYLPVFIDLLTNKNNRLQWGGMTAIAAMTSFKPHEIYAALPQIIQAAESGSVITRDYAVKILIQLYTIQTYSDSIFPLMIEQLLKSPPNQLPMYAELMMPAIDKKNKLAFTKALNERLDDMEKESKRKRVEKVIKKIS